MRAARLTALVAYLASMLLIVAWETWWAPPTPLARTFWIVLKTAPLIAVLPWLLRASAYAYVLASLVLLLYFCEGVASVYGGMATSEQSSVLYGAAEIVLAVLFIVAASLFVRISFRTPSTRARAEREL